MEIRMQRELNEIKELLVSFSRYIELENSNGEFGINKTAENIIAGLLGIVFDCDLKNVNEDFANHPGIDLADRNKKIAFQITSENSRKKILETLNTIMTRELYVQYDKVYIYVLGKKKKYKNLQVSINEILNDVFSFSERQILDYEDIYRILSNYQDVNKIITAKAYLGNHVSASYDESLL